MYLKKNCKKNRFKTSPQGFDRDAKIREIRESLFTILLGNVDLYSFRGLKVDAGLSLPDYCVKIELGVVW